MLNLLGIERDITFHINQFKIMNYSTGCAFNMDDMFMNFPYDKLEMSCEDCKEINGNPHRDHLVKKVFRECVKEVLEDMIENNITFVLPTQGRHAEMHVKRTYGEDFKNARRNGKWRDVDFLKSGFSGNQIVLNIKSGHMIKTKPVYVNKSLKKRLTNYTNKGKQYC